MYRVDYSTDYQCTYDKGKADDCGSYQKRYGEQADPIYIQQLDKEQLHRSVTDVDEIRRKFTNLRAEYLENEENWAFPVNGQNRGDKEQRNKL